MLIFCVLQVFSINTALAKDCDLTAKTTTEKAIVKWVYDGDTILVTDPQNKNKRKVRIIGIDTPEVKHHQQKAQRYGAKAREALRVELKRNQYQVLLEYDQVQKDRYKRQLAHVYLADGTNISEWLLQQGFAKTLIIPPNVKHVNCYQSAEHKAQRKNSKIWRLKSHKLTLMKELKSGRTGYIRLVAKVKKVKIKKKSIFLSLEKFPNKKPIRVRIRKKHLAYFTSIDPRKLTNHTIIVTGLLKKKRSKRTITLSHGSQLALLLSTHEKEVLKPSVAPLLKWSL